MNLQNNKKPLLILTGPTAAGKSALSIRLAKEINGSIISADSMQVYRHMDIGSAKISRREMEGVPHYLIDILEPTEAFNVFLFQQYAKAAMEEIYEQDRIPIIVGGTGFYIQSVLYDIDFSESQEEDGIRKRLEDEANTEAGRERLFAKLKEVDPVSAEVIHPNNAKRVIRALEYYEQNHSPISAHNEEQREKDSPYAYRYFVLHRDREALYQAIDVRVDKMMEAGLLQEVEQLRKMGCTSDMVSMQGLGYKELMEYYDGKCTLEDAVYRIKRNTRHFAKRQLTWFRRERDVIWINKEQEDAYERILQSVQYLR